MARYSALMKRQIVVKYSGRSLDSNVYVNIMRRLI